MAFTQDFNVANGTKLTALGFQQLQGTADEGEVQNNKLARTTTAGGKLFYSPSQDTGGNGVQTVQMDNPRSVNIGICVYATVTNNLLTAYYARAQTGYTSARLWKIVDGGTPSLLRASNSIPDCIGLELRVTKNGNGEPVLEMFRQGVSIGAPFTDTSSPILSGRRGIAFLGAVTVDDGDNYVDNSGAAAPTGTTFTFNERPAGFTWEGKRSASAVNITGTYTGTPSAIQARVVDDTGTPVPGFDWAVVDAAPAGGTFDFTLNGVPIGLEYYAEVRDGTDEATETVNTNYFRVGTVIVIMGQSQSARLRSLGAGVATPTAEAVGRVNILHAIDTTGRDSREATVSPMSASVGSGTVSAANQIAADSTEPVMMVELSRAGTGIVNWLNDDANSFGWNIYTGYVTTVLTALANQCTEFMLFWGTDLVSPEELNPGQFATDIETLMSQIATDFFTFRPHLTIMPHPRSADDSAENGSNWRLRNAQYVLATSGDPNYSLSGWILDVIMDADGSPHQDPGAAGNVRFGLNIGRFIAARHLSTAPLYGPQIIQARFKTTDRTAIVLTYDKDIETPSGNTTNLDQFYVTTDAFATGSNLIYKTTGNITGARTVEIPHPSAGNWVGQTVHVDYLRDTPYDTTNGRYGGEAGVAVLVDDFIHGTDAFEGGRGMQGAPIMDDGMLVEVANTAPPPPTAEITAGQTITFATKADLVAANFRLKSGTYTLDGTQEPPAFRYVNDEGTTSGFNVEITTT